MDGRRAATRFRCASVDRQASWFRRQQPRHPARPVATVFLPNRLAGSCLKSHRHSRGIHTSRKVSEDRETCRIETGRPSMRPGRAGADGSPAARPEIAVLMPETPLASPDAATRGPRQQHVLGNDSRFDGDLSDSRRRLIRQRARDGKRAGAGRRLSQSAPGQNGRGRTNPHSVHEEGAGVLGIHAGHWTFRCWPMRMGAGSWELAHPSERHCSS